MMHKSVLVSVLLCSFVATPAVAESVHLQAQGSMFRATVVLNGKLVSPALIDTGATYLFLCGTTAKSLGLSLGTSSWVSTANGVIQARYAMVESIRISSIVIHSVPALVALESTPCLGEVTLGMSVLHKLESMTLKDGVLTLSGRPASRQAPVGPPQGNWFGWK